MVLTDPIEAPAETTPEAVLAEYEAALRAVVEAEGVDRVVAETGLEPAVVGAIESGDVPDLDLSDATAILAVRGDGSDAETLRAAVRDHLLLEMSSAMLTVDRIAVDLERDYDPKEVQGMIEGRHPTTLAEYARIHYFVASAKSS